MVSRKCRQLVGFYLEYLSFCAIYPLEFNHSTLSIQISSSIYKIWICRVRRMLNTMFCLLLFFTLGFSIISGQLALTKLSHMCLVFYFLGSVVVGTIDFCTAIKLGEIVSCINSAFYSYDIRHPTVENARKHHDTLFQLLVQNMFGSLVFPSFAVIVYGVECEVHALASVPYLNVCSNSLDGSTVNSLMHGHGGMDYGIILLCLIQFFVLNSYTGQVTFHIVLMPLTYAIIEMIQDLRESEELPKPGTITQRLKWYQQYQSCQIMLFSLINCWSFILPLIFVVFFISITITTFAAIGLPLQVISKLAVIVISGNLSLFLYFIFQIANKISESSNQVLKQQCAHVQNTLKNYNLSEQKLLKKLLGSHHKIRIKFGPLTCSESNTLFKVFDAMIDAIITLLVTYNEK